MTSSDSLFPSKYLKSADLEGRTITVIMDRIRQEEIGAKKDINPVLYFKDKTKGVVLNKTNVRRIEAIYGKNMDNWWGKPIQLHVESTTFEGKDTTGLRVVQTAPGAASVAAQRPLNPAPAPTAAKPDFANDLDDSIPF